LLSPRKYTAVDMARLAFVVAPGWALLLLFLSIIDALVPFAAILLTSRSHRLGSIKLADEIFVFSGGRLVQQGTHAELMAQPASYHDMYQSQLD